MFAQHARSRKHTTIHQVPPGVPVGSRCSRVGNRASLHRGREVVGRTAAAGCQRTHRCSCCGVGRVLRRIAVAYRGYASRVRCAHSAVRAHSYVGRGCDGSLGSVQRTTIPRTAATLANYCVSYFFHTSCVQLNLLLLFVVLDSQTDLIAQRCTRCIVARNFDPRASFLTRCHRVRTPLKGTTHHSTSTENLPAFTFRCKVRACVLARTGTASPAVFFSHRAARVVQTDVTLVATRHLPLSNRGS
jgi:hypothetical protein